MTKAAREEAVQVMTAAEEEVKQGQYSYNARWSMREPLPVGTREHAAYAARKDRIWMDDLQGVKEKLAAQVLRRRNTSQTSGRSLSCGSTQPAWMRSGRSRG